MIAQPLDLITRDDIEALLADGIPEGLRLEYKADLPNTESSRKRLLKVVTSFANTDGGDVLLGIAEARRNGHNTALAGKITGLADVTGDEAKRLVADLIRSGTDPAVLSYDLHSVEGFELGPVLIVRVQRSLVGPHMVTLGHDNRYYGRAPGSTYLLDSSELRRAFALSQSVPALLRAFREQRLSQFFAAGGPVQAGVAPWMMLHIVPLRALEPAQPIDFSSDETRPLVMNLVPMITGSWSHRYNADGFLSYTSHREDETEVVHSYVQLMRSGALEAATTAMFREDEGRRIIPLSACERAVVKALRDYWAVLTGLEVSGPAFILLTLLRVEGVAVTDRMGFRSDHLIDRDEVQLPEVLIMDNEPDLPVLMKPIFDGVAQSAGLPCSPSYDLDGRWLLEDR